MVAWRGFLAALRAPRTLRLKPSGEFLKTAHWAVFLTEFHLIGSSPRRKALSNGSVVFFLFSNLVGAEGLEPSRLAAADFKSAASAIPPRSHLQPQGILSNKVRLSHAFLE